MNNEKIRLRAMEPEDLDVLYQIENNQKLWDVGTTNVPYSRYALQNYIVSQTNDIFADRQLRLMIENEEGQTIGIIDIINFEPQHQRAEVGIVIMSEWRMKGYAEVALSKLMDYCRHTLHLHQLYAFVADDNKASLRLFQKTGFVTGAALNDWLFDGHKYHNAQLMQLFL